MFTLFLFEFVAVYLCLCAADDIPPSLNSDDDEPPALDDDPPALDEPPALDDDDDVPPSIDDGLFRVLLPQFVYILLLFPVPLQI